MKKSIFLFFAAILCATSAWAHDLAANQYVYFEKPSDWTQVALLLGHDTYSIGYNMTKISNTNLYYWKTASWGGYKAYAFIDAKDWGGESNGSSSKPDTRKKWATHYSSTFTSAIAKCHLFNSTKSIKSSTTATDYATVVNRTQTIKVQVKDGENWVDATVTPADLTASTYALKSSTASEAKSASLAKESATVSATVTAAYSATVSLSCTNVLDGYMFEGWYDANGNKITSYTVSDAHTVYARFIQSAEETNEVTVTYMCGTTSVATAVAEFVGVESEKSFTAPTVTGYKFTNWTIGAGIDLKAGTASDATITVVSKSASNDYTLVANYEEVIETVYFINTNKWAIVNIHKWNGKAAASSWPGEKLTASGEKIGEYDVYSYTAKQGDYANVIFNSKTSGSDGGNAQTADLTWTAGKYYIYNYGGKSDWYTKEDAEALLVTPVVTHDIVVKAVVPEAWTSTTIGIHYWGEGISGTSTPVATEKDGNWNKYTIKEVPEGVSVNVIFLNGTSWPDDKSKQTANITGITEDKCFQISATKLDGEGKCTVKEVDCDATIEPEVDVYTIMGAGELGLSWDLAKTGNDMTKQADGTYTLVKEGLDLATTGTYEYKVVKNHSWDWSIPSGNTNQTLKVDKDGTYTVTFTLSADKKKLTADALCTAEKEVILDCFVAGTINLVGGTADFTDKLAMTYDEETKTYSKTFTALAAGNYQMKVVYGSDWLGYDKLTKPVPANVTEGDDKKIKFSLAEAGDVTVTYNVEEGIGLVGTFAAPETKYYIAGTQNLTGFDWKENGLQLTKADDLYKHTFSALAAGTYEFKITDGTWTKTWGFGNLNAAYEEVSEGVDGEGNPNGNIKFTTEEAKNITVIFELATGKITIDGLTEKAPAEPVTVYFINSGEWAEVACYYWGGLNGSAWPGVQMTATGETYEAEGWNVYAITFPGDNTQCIFTDNKAEGTTQTGDLKVENGKYYCYANGIWYERLADVDPLDTRIYLKGEMNEWCATEGWCDMFRKEDVSENVAYRTTWLEAETTYEFKIEDAGKWFSNTGTMTKDNCTGWTFEESVNDNAKITTEYAGDYTFVWDMTTKKLSVVYPELTPEVMDLMVTDMVFDGDGTFSGTDNMMGIEFALVVGSELEDGVYSLDASSTVNFGGTLFTDVTGMIAPDTETFASASAIVYGFYMGMYFQLNVEMSAGGSAGVPVEILDGTASVDDATGELTVSGNWDGDDVYVKAPGFNGESYECEEVWFYVGGTDWETASIIAFGPATITVDGNDVLVEGTVMSGMTGTNYDLFVIGTFPAAEEPDYTRTTTAGNFGTICLPFGSTNYTGMELFECVGRETGKVYIASVTTLEAGVPYIFLATGDELAVYSDGTTAATPGDNNGLYGTFTNDTEVAVGNYILKDNALCQAEATCYVNANRAYLVMSEVPEGAPQQMPGRRYIGMSTKGENEATGFENITAPAGKTIKAVVNGQLIIIRDGEMYNAQGVRF